MDPHEVADKNAQAHVEEVSREVISPDMANEMSLSIWETILANPKAIMYSLVLAMGPMVYGFDLIIVSLAVAMPSFQHAYGSKLDSKYIIPAMWLALWNSMIQVGAMAGAMACGSIADRFGRKVSYTTGGIIAASGIFLVYFSDRVATLNDKRTMFLIGKIVVGVSFGLINTSFLTLVSEIAPTRLRGPILSSLTFFTVLGQLIGLSIVYTKIGILAPSSYRIVFASQWALAGVAIIAGFVVPESPIYFIKRNQLSKALKAYKRIYSTTEPEAGLAALQVIVEHEVMMQKNRDSWSYRQCLVGSNWRRTRIVIYANILQQFVGITMVTNASYFLELGGMSAKLALGLNLVHLGIGLPCLFLAFFTMTIFGRRSLLLTGTTCHTILWTAMGIAGCFNATKSTLLFLGICLIVIYEFYALTVGAVYPVVSAEASSVNLRAASQSIGFFSNFIFAWLFAFTVPYMFDAGEGNLGGKVGFIFAFLSIVGFAIVWFEIPETKNRTYVELDEMFEKGLPTRQFRDYVCTGTEMLNSKSEEAGV